MRLTEKEQEFINIYKGDNNWTIAQILFVAKGNNFNDWFSLDKKQAQSYHAQGYRIKKRLINAGLIVERIQTRADKSFKTNSFVRKTAEHIKGAKTSKNADAIAAKALTSKEIEKILPPAPADTQTLTQDGERVKKQHVLNIYDWFLQQKGLPSLTQKDHMEGFLTALAYNCATVEEYEDNNGNTRRQVRQPAAAIQAVKTLAEMGGHLQPSGQINIQVNNIWQEIATKRMKELNIDVSDTDGEKTTS